MTVKIRVVDTKESGLTSESIATLQALYSRSNASVDEHLEKVRAEGSDKFMETYYLNYGHKSIGDCGTTAVFIEGLSMPAAKAIQDSPLYNGQECSTRYISYDNVGYVDLAPELPDEVHALYERAKGLSATLYRIVYDSVTRHMLHILGKQGYQTDNKVLRNAIHAKACDYARGYLLLGSKTQVSWTTTLRQFGDRLNVLEVHPLYEVRRIARSLRAELHSRYPSSFKAEGYANTLAFNKEWAGCSNYMQGFDGAGVGVGTLDYTLGTIQYGTLFSYWTQGDNRLGNRLGSKRVVSNILSKMGDRPPHVELPAFLNGLGRVRCEFLVDYGSFRDLQRHRSATVRHTYPSGELNLNAFYTYPKRWMEPVEHTDYTVGAEYEKAMSEFHRLYSELVCVLPPELGTEAQYLYPMGQQISMTMEMGLASAVYIAELRSGKAVHPTARCCAQGLAFALLAEFRTFRDPRGSYLHLNVDPNEFVQPSGYDHDEIFVARGLQTFKKDTV